MRSNRLRPALLLAATIAAGCQMQTNAAPTLSATSQPLSAIKRTSPTNELFVGDGSTIYVFPIENGLPAATPSRTLQTDLGLLNIAVGADGTIYAASESPTEVAVYAPGAQGSDQPERVLDTSDAWSLAVDGAGFLYAGIPDVGVEIYAPGAQGPDQPVATIPETRFVGGLGIDVAGNLYVADYGTLTEYATPETDPTMIRSTCFAVKINPNGVALNPQGTAFVAVDGAEHFPRHSYISPVASDETGCPFKRRRIYANPSFHNPIGVGELDGHIFVADPFYGNGHAAVVVMDESQRGHHPPLFILTNPGFSHPRGVAIGP